MKFLIALLLLVALGVGGFLYKDKLIQYANDFGIPQMLGIDLAALGLSAPSAPQNDEIVIPQAAQQTAPAQPSLKSSCEGGNVNDCLKFADEQIKANKPLEAANALVKPCEAKNNKSCETIANIYNDLAKKYSDDSINYYKRSCDNGGLDGCYGLGVKYFRGEVVKQDFKQSFALFKKVCDGGKVEGCNNLAVMYNNANGVKKNIKLARQLFKKACDSGYKPSCANLTKTK